MFAGSCPGGSWPFTTWHFTHCQRPNRSRPCATVSGTLAAGLGA